MRRSGGTEASLRRRMRKTPHTDASSDRDILNPGKARTDCSLPCFLLAPQRTILSPTTLEDPRAAGLGNRDGGVARGSTTHSRPPVPECSAQGTSQGSSRRRRSAPPLGGHPRAGDPQGFSQGQELGQEATAGPEDVGSACRVEPHYWPASR